MKDEYFFGKGACHVLAFEFKKLNPEYEIYVIKPHGPRGYHVFATNNKVFFDYQGYTPYNSYLKDYTKLCESLFENWGCDVIKIHEGFNAFCEKYDHMKIEYFLHDPRPRALEYIFKKTG